MIKIIAAAATLSLLAVSGAYAQSLQDMTGVKENAATLALIACGDDFRTGGYPSKGDCLVDIVVKHHNTEAAKVAEKAVRAMLAGSGSSSSATSQDRKKR